MDFSVSIKTCLSKYACLQGRASRGEFWCFAVFTYFMSAFALFLDSAFLSYLYYDGDVYYYDGLSLLGAVLQCGVLAPLITASIRRLHDSNRSGWWLLLLPTGVGIIPLVLLWMRPSDGGDNDYGAEPCDGEDTLEENPVS